MTCGRVHSHDLSVGVDGPGTRFVLFLAGCPLRCLYCHSPDTWQLRDGTLSTADEVMAEVDRYTWFISAADALLDAVDLVLLDIKSWHPDTYRRVTGVEVEPTLLFARRLAERGTPVWVRFVLVPGLTDAPSNVDGIARFVALLPNVARVEVLPFHRLGTVRYTALGIPFPLAATAPPDEALLDRVRGQFAEQGLTVC